MIRENRLYHFLGSPIDDLVQTRDHFMAVLEGTNAGTFEWNVQTGKTLYNERWAEILGYT
jgi:PAS domain-containing protein